MSLPVRFVPLVLACAVLCGCGPEQPGKAGTTTEGQTATQVPADVEPVTVTTTAASLPPVPEAITAAVANPDRPADDIARDADRKPADVLTYFEVHPGEIVFELVAGGGYYTELFSRTVGPSGHVVATRLAPERLADG